MKLEDEIKKFILMWCLILVTISLYQFINNHYLNYYLIVTVIILLNIFYFKPNILKKVYCIWMKFSEIIGGIISKIIMFILFYGLFTTIAIFLRLANKDLLNKKIDKNKKTYWIDRESQPQPMKNQF